MGFGRKTPVLRSTRLELRLPRRADYAAWTKMRSAGVDFLQKWEPIRPRDYETRGAFIARMHWANRAAHRQSAFPFMIIRREDERLLGAITMDNVRFGAARAGTLGYWIGEVFARNGYMTEAVSTVMDFAFDQLDLSRIEAACLPENTASRGVLERCGFENEGVAQSFLQINGRWRTHVLYANLRQDRRGLADA